MNKYVIPICNIPENQIYNLIIIANSYESCQEKIMDRLSKYSDSYDYETFLKDLDKQDILVGEISDIEEL